MNQTMRSRGGRRFLLAIGILLTTTAGHAAARIMALQIAQGSSAFAFELAIMLTALLFAAYVVAVAGHRPARETLAPSVDSAPQPRIGAVAGR